MNWHTTRTATTALVAVGSAAALAVGAAPALAVEDVTTARLAGQDRFGTAVDIAQERVAGTDDIVQTVVLAASDDFPDALAGAGLAGAVRGVSGVVEAPVLLTTGDVLTDATRQALQELSVRRVVLLGGPDAVSQAVQDELEQDYEVSRVAGADRYATAAEAARRLVTNNDGLGEIGGLSTVLVASGQDFADALTGGAVASAARVPVLLTDPDELPAATAEVLDELAPEQVVLLGGEVAVSPAVQAAIEQQGTATRRLGGADRQATAAQIADYALAELGFEGRRAVLARGDSFPDALAAGPHAGRTRAPILLTQDTDTLSAATRDWLEDNRDTLETIEVLGGTDAISPEVVQQAERAAEPPPSDGSDEPFPADRSPDTQQDSDDARLNVVDMDFGRQDGYDRLVLELTGPGTPGWTFEYVDRPRQQGSGNPVDIRGDFFLKGTITGVIAPAEPDGQEYTGPEEIVPESSGVLQEAQIGSWFEGYREVFVGLSSDQPFRVFQLDDPTRIVLDVQHPTDEPADGSGQTFGVAPQESVNTDVGSPLEFRVFTRYDDRPFTGPVDLALFPCQNTQVTGSGPDVFADDGGDRRADGIGTSDTGAARIIGVSGAETNATQVRGAAPGDDDILRFTVNAAAADCTVPVVYDDADRNGQLDVDADGVPTEPYGVGRIAWQ